MIDSHIWILIILSSSAAITSAIPQLPTTNSFEGLVGNIFAPDLNASFGLHLFDTPGSSQNNTALPENENESLNYVPKYTPCGSNSVCVPFYLCNQDTKTLNTDGKGIAQERIDIYTCSASIEVCCSMPDKKSEPTAQILEAPKECGYRNPNGVSFKIVEAKNGESEYGEFPWMIAILQNEKIGDKTLIAYQCGGSLIHPSVVLTSAHCIHDKEVNKLIVRAGEWDTKTKAEPYPEQNLEIIEIVVHENFNKGNLFNDIALLMTKEPFVLSQIVNTICLPPHNMIFDQSQCFATGWGKNSFGNDAEYGVILKKVDVPLVPHNECQTRLRETRLGKYFQLHESFVCAGGEIGKDLCTGDGGSPLSCPVPGMENRFYQIGIVAWGIGCGNKNPAAYANVPHFRSWIDQVFIERNIEQTYYTMA